MYEIKSYAREGNNLAGLLSFIVPGVGQVYNGRWVWAIVWLLITPGLWIGTGGFVGWVCHFMAAYQAYSYGGTDGTKKENN
jgi:TM2 domain-containing membrane protein YozV